MWESQAAFWPDFSKPLREARAFGEPEYAYTRDLGERGSINSLHRGPKVSARVAARKACDHRRVWSHGALGLL